MFSSLFGKRTPNPHVTVMEHDALKEALRGNECVIVDVREPNAYSSGHIPGAITLRRQAFAFREASCACVPIGRTLFERFAKGARKRSPRCLPLPRSETWLEGGRRRRD
jgi:rhodanese-related sulfurtransferase